MNNKQIWIINHTKIWIIMTTFHFLLDCRSSHFQKSLKFFLMNVFILYSLKNILHITKDENWKYSFKERWSDLDFLMQVTLGHISVNISNTVDEACLFQEGRPPQQFRGFFCDTPPDTQQPAKGDQRLHCDADTTTDNLLSPIPSPEHLFLCILTGFSSPSIFTVHSLMI